MLIAALMFLSCFIFQSGHFYSLSFSVSSELWYPQTWQILDDSSNLHIIRMIFPDHSGLYSNFITKLLHTESIMDCSKLWFLIIPLIFKVFSATAWFSQKSLKESLCWKLLLWFMIFSWSTAGFYLAVSRFLEPFCFRLTLFWSTWSLFKEFSKYFGFSNFSSVEITAESLFQHLHQ